MTDDILRMTTPEHFRALAHPMRHRLLFALGERPSTVSQLAAILNSHKGNISHHLKVLVAAGLVTPADTRRVRGGTEQYYRRTARRLDYSGPEAEGATAAAFQAIAAEVAEAEAEPFLVLRTMRLTDQQVAHVTAALTDLAETPEHADEGLPRYGMLLGLYQQRRRDPTTADGAGQPGAIPGGTEHAPGQGRQKPSGRR